MNFHIVFCGILFVVSSAACAGLRYPRQSWQDPDDPHEFHFPDMPFPGDNDRYNDVFDFPGGPPGNFPPGLRPGFRPGGGNRGRPNQNQGWSSGNGQSSWGIPDDNQGWSNMNRPTTSRPSNNQNWGSPDDNMGWQNVNRPTTSRPSNNQNWGSPDDNMGWQNMNRPTTSTTTQRTTTDEAGSSTPRTFHLAPEGCDCPSTPQFNPVCGSDGNTYKNSGLLKCFRLCGVDVSQKRMGAC
ncbi:UNVERIFIED_CONTAM: hypothetical protein PYX00_006351 [Menopon gallinae]|uniref:Kazal-like domain-containing protein n=1 Tax=Menopon gallinae TaxID=328185 RepID=A0AAW2HWW1_9NEOP